MWKKMRFVGIICALALLMEVLLFPVQGRVNAADEDYASIERPLPYSDVREHDYYAEALLFFTVTELLTPSEDKFHPEQAVTRGEFFEWLHSFLQLGEEDPSAADAGQAARRLAELGIILGDEDGSLMLDSTITRGEAAVIFQRIRQLEPSADALNRFTDVAHGSWYSEAVSAMANYQLIQGRPEGRFAPHEGMTRAEAITLLYRVFFELNQIEEIRDDHIVVSGKLFPYHPDLQGLFAAHNRETLQWAAMNFVVKDGMIVKVTRLEIASNGENRLILDGGGAVIDGNLYVSRPSVALEDITVTGNLYVTDQVSSFSGDHLSVEGFTIFMPANDAEPPLPVRTTDSDLGALIVSRSVHFDPDTEEEQLFSNPQPRKQQGEVSIASAVNSQSIRQQLQELGLQQGDLGKGTDNDYWSRESYVRDILELLTSTEGEIQDIESEYNSHYINAPYFGEYANWLGDNRYNLGMPGLGNSGYLSKEKVEEIIKNIQDQITNDSYNLSDRSEPVIIGTPDQIREERRNERRAAMDVKLKEGNRPVIVVDDTNLSAPPDTPMTSVVLVDVADFTVDAHIKYLVVTQTDVTETSLTGTGQIDRAEVRYGGQVTLSVQGDIKQLIISNPEAVIRVGEDTIIHNIELPDGVELKDIIRNIDTIGDNIRQVNGEPYSPPANTSPSTGGGSSRPSEPEEPVAPPVPAITDHKLGTVVDGTVTLSVYARNADAIYWVIPQFLNVDPTIRPQPDRIFRGQDYNPSTEEWISAAYAGNAPVSGAAASIALDATWPIDQIWVVAAKDVDATNPRLSDAYTIDADLDYPGPGAPVKFTARFDSGIQAVVEGSVDGIPFKLEIEGSIDDEPDAEFDLHVQKLLRSNDIHALNLYGLETRAVKVTLGIPSAVTGGEAVLFERAAAPLEGLETIWKYRGGYVNERQIRGTPTRPSGTLAIAAAAAVPTPQNVLAFADPDSVTLSWDASAGATAYLIYRYSDTEGQTFVGETTSTTYTDTDVLGGMKYEYEVTALRDGFESAHPAERTLVTTP